MRSLLPVAPAAARRGRSPADANGRVETSVWDVPVHVWLFVLALLLTMFSGSWDRLGLPIGPDRLLFPAAIALALLDPGTRLRRPAAVHWCMLAFAVVAALSLLFLGSIDTVSLFAFSDRIAMPFLVFAVAPLVFDTPVRRTLLLRAVTMAGLYLGVTAVAESLEFAPLVQPGYILQAREELIARGTGEFPRAGGPMLAAEGNGMANAMAAMVAAHVMVRDRRPWSILGAIVLPLGLLGAFLCLTRSVWLGALLGVVVVVASHRSLWRWVPSAAGAVVVVAVLGALAVPDLVEGAVERGGTSRSVYDRFNTNAAALRILTERPLTGIGWSEFLRGGQTWVRQSDVYPLTSVNIEIHNVFLSRAAELGIPAAVLFAVCVLLGPFLAAWRARGPEMRAWRATLVAVLCVWIVPSMLSPNPYVLPNLLMWTVAGVVFGLTTDPDTARPRVPSLADPTPDPDPLKR